MTESEIIEKARIGDGDAWSAIVGLHQEPVFRFSYLILGDPDEAADNAQETFLRARRYFQRYDGGRDLRPWLLSIAGNLARNRLRAAGRYISALKRWARTIPEARTPESRVIESSAHDRLWEAIRRLPQRDQHIIYLRFFLELNVSETAQSLEIAPGTVKSRLSRALDRLRSVLRNDFPDLEEGL